MAEEATVWGHTLEEWLATRAERDRLNTALYELHQRRDELEAERDHLRIIVGAYTTLATPELQDAVLELSRKVIASGEQDS